jgi:tape measure domain-containing protein
VASPPSVDRGLSVDFQRRRLERSAAEAFTRRQARIQQVGGLARLSEIEGTATPGVAATLARAIPPVATAAILAGGAVAFLGAKFAGATARATDFGQRSVLALTSIMKNSGAAETQFNAVRLEAGRLGLDVPEAVKSFTQLANARFDTSTARDLVRMSADLQALTGDSQSASLALRAITQIKMKGRLQAEEITGQLAEHGISADAVYEQLGKTLGKTREQVLKLQKSGDLSADVAIPAILAAVRSQLGVDQSGGFAEKMVAGSMSGLAGKMAAGWDNAWITLGRRVSPGAARLTRLVDGAFNRIGESPAFGRFVDRFGNAFDGAVSFVEKNWPRIEKTITAGVDLIASTATRGVAAMASGARFIVDNWGPVRVVLYGAAAAAGLVLAPFIALSAVGYAVAGATAYMTAKLIEGSAEMGRWLRLAGAVAMVIPGLQGIGATLTAAGITTDRGGTLQTLEQQIRSESQARQAGSFVGSGGVQPIVVPPGRSVGDVTINVPVSALDLEDPQGAGQTVAGLVRGELRRVLEHG